MKYAKPNRVLIGVISLVVGSVDPAHARLTSLDLRDVHSMIRSDRSAYSLVYGDYLLESHLLKNLRFDGNYSGTPKEGLDCSAYTASIQDCPQDARSALIQSLFPSPNRVGRTVIPNQGSSDDIARNLSPAVIGQILEFMNNRGEEVSQLLRTRDQVAQEKLELKLASIIFETLNPKVFKPAPQKQSILGKIKKTESELWTQRRLKSLATAGESCSFEDLAEFDRQIATLESVLKNSETSLERVETKLREEVIQNKINEKNDKIRRARYFSHLIIQSMLEELSDSGSKNLVKHLFLAYFMGKAEGRKDIVSMLERMPSLLSDLGSHLVSNKRFQDQFIASRFSEADLKDLLRQNENVRDLGDIGKVYALNGVAKKMASGLPKTIDYSKARPLVEGAGAESYSDCGETSARNFINRYLGGAVFKESDQNESEFDLSRLRPPLHPYEKVSEYFKKYDSVDAQQKAPTHGGVSPRDQWGDIVSNLPHGSYVRSCSGYRHEITGGLSGMLGILGDLLFHKNEDYQRLENAEKLEFLVKGLSEASGEAWSWKLSGYEGENQKDAVNQATGAVTIGIYVSGVLRDSWLFQKDPNHFDLKPETKDGRTQSKNLDWVTHDYDGKRNHLSQKDVRRSYVLEELPFNQGSLARISSGRKYWKFLQVSADSIRDRVDLLAQLSTLEKQEFDNDPRLGRHFVNLFKSLPIEDFGATAKALEVAVDRKLPVGEAFELFFNKYFSKSMDPDFTDKDQHVEHLNSLVSLKYPGLLAAVVEKNPELLDLGEVSIEALQTIIVGNIKSSHLDGLKAYTYEVVRRGHSDEIFYSPNNVLSEVARSGNVQALEFFKSHLDVAKMHSVISEGWWGVPPLSIAIDNKKDELAEKLLEVLGKDDLTGSIKRVFQHPRCYAIWLGNNAILRQILSKVDTKDLRYALCPSKKGSDADPVGLVEVAVKNGNFDAARVIIQHLKSEVNAADFLAAMDALKDFPTEARSFLEYFIAVIEPSRLEKLLVYLNATTEVHVLFQMALRGEKELFEKYLDRLPADFAKSGVGARYGFENDKENVPLEQVLKGKGFDPAFLNMVRERQRLP